MFSASLIIVENSSNVRSFLEMVVAKLALIVRTNLSKCPPIHGGPRSLMFPPDVGRRQILANCWVLLHLQQEGFPSDESFVIV